MSAPARGRGHYDPFAPVGRPFPAARLSRAGVDEDTVARLRDEWSTMDPGEQADLARFVARNTDRSIVVRYQGRRTREDLERMTVDDDLIPLLRERGLSTHGRKAELIDRLLDAYDTPKGALTSGQVPVVPDTPDDGPQAASGDDRAGNAAPDAAPPTPATPSAPASAPSTQAPGPQTPDAEPAPATPAPADTTKEAPRG